MQKNEYKSLSPFLWVIYPSRGESLSRLKYGGLGVFLSCSFSVGFGSVKPCGYLAVILPGFSVVAPGMRYRKTLPLYCRYRSPLPCYFRAIGTDGGESLLWYLSGTYSMERGLCPRTHLVPIPPWFSVDKAENLPGSKI